MKALSSHVFQGEASTWLSANINTGKIIASSNFRYSTLSQKLASSQTVELMASLFGKITEETPNFEVLKKTDAYEIRRYAPCIFATTHYSVSQYNVFACIAVANTSSSRVEMEMDLVQLLIIFLERIKARYPGKLPMCVHCSSFVFSPTLTRVRKLLWLHQYSQKMIRPSRRRYFHLCWSSLLH